MAAVPPRPTPSEADREKRLVAASSVAAAVLLVTMKLVVGLATNSLGILSEAAHSLLDLVAAAVTLWAVRASSLPADSTHTYGHGKIENLSALFETVLLLATCGWIVYESGRRLFFADSEAVEANFWSFLVVAVSIVVDISRSRALRRAAEKHQSQALEADALHFATDVWSSTVVLIGLAGVWLGNRLALPWLVQADAVAALGVAAIVVWVSLKLGKKSIDDLLDSAPGHLQGEVTAAVARVPGVLRVEQARLRRSGPTIFADVTVGVARGEGLEDAHRVADQAEAAVRSVIPGADVVVHVEPIAASDEAIWTTVRVLAARHGLGAHGIRLYDEGTVRHLELHLEVNETLSLDAAHRQATEFEKELQECVPGLARVVTHLEPSGDSTIRRRTRPAAQIQVKEALVAFMSANPIAIRPHDIEVQQTGPELAVSFHCELDAGTAITEAHDLTVQLEQHLRARIPNLGRVVIHVEPAGGDRPE